MSDTSHILTAFHSAIKNQSTGILKIQSGTNLRQIMFSKGICLDIGSNVKEELPGTFLFQQKILNHDQYQNYLQKCSAPKTNQWMLANTEIQLQPSVLLDQRRLYAKKIINNIDLAQVTNLQFQTLPNIPSDQAILPTLELIMLMGTKFSVDQIKGFKKEFQDATTRITIAKEPDKNDLDDDQNGLFTVIQHNATLHDVLDSSFLEKEKIYRWMLAFELSGFIRMESSAESDKRRFLEALSDEQKKTREMLKKEIQKTSVANFYEILGIDTGADAEDINQGMQTQQQKLSDPKFQSLFFQGEEYLPSIILEKVKHAFAVLSNPEKKQEYDAFLRKGSNANFLDHSQTILEEKLLNELNQLITARKFDDAINFIGAQITAHPEFMKLYTTLVDLIKGLNMTANDALNQKIFEWFKLGISKNPQEYQLFQLLGEWCMMLSQLNNAMKAFQKALHIKASSNKIRNYILQIDSSQGRQIIVEAIYQNLETLNHFEMLGLESSASDQDIRENYREISKHLHPDRFFNSQNQSLKEMSKRVFKEIVASYMVLKDPQKRKDYADHLFSSQRKKEEKQKTTLPKSLQSRKYYDQAVLSIEDGNFSSAKLNLQLALSYEPDNYLLQKMLKDIQSKLANAIV